MYIHILRKDLLDEPVTQLLDTSFKPVIHREVFNTDRFLEGEVIIEVKDSIYNYYLWLDGEKKLQKKGDRLTVLSAITDSLEEIDEGVIDTIETSGFSTIDIRFFTGSFNVDMSKLNLADIKKGYVLSKKDRNNIRQIQAIWISRMVMDEHVNGEPIEEVHQHAISTRHMDKLLKSIS